MLFDEKKAKSLETLNFRAFPPRLGEKYVKALMIIAYTVLQDSLTVRVHPCRQTSRTPAI
jgi:hypothetical protein